MMRLSEVYGSHSGQPVERIGHLSQLKNISPKAFAAFVEFLVEDCDSEFFVSRNGTITVQNSDGTTMTWNPQSTSMDIGSGWEQSE